MTILWLFTDARHPEYPVGTFLAGDTETGITAVAFEFSTMADCAKLDPKSIATDMVWIEKKYPYPYLEVEASERAKDAARMALLKRDGVTVKGRRLTGYWIEDAPQRA